MKSILNSALNKIAAELESRLEVAVEYIGHADRVVVSAALGTLTGAVNDALDALQALVRNPEAIADAVSADRMDRLRDALYASLPPISGGAPDDFEECDEAIFGDEWPEYPDAEVDGYTWEATPDHQGETPVEVLALDQPTFEPSTSDWQDYADWCDGRLSEADHLAVHGCC